MKDPTRIPRVLDALRDAWEGQPDLELATLFGVLSARGLGWGTGDDELVAALEQMSAAHPARVVDSDTSFAMVTTESPSATVTVDGAGRRITVRSADRDLQPVSWRYDALHRCEVGMPLVADDSAGIRHRLGVVARIHRVVRPADPFVHAVAMAEPQRAYTATAAPAKEDGEDEESDVSAATFPEALAHQTWGLHTEDEDAASLIIIDAKRVHRWQKQERGLTKSVVRWRSLTGARPGQRLVVVPMSGEAPIDCGETLEAFPIDPGIDSSVDEW